MAITMDSPVAAVLGGGRAADRFGKGLGLRTVGDLLHHFPRRYLKTAELTDVPQLHEGDMLTVVGEIVHSAVKSHKDRRTHRLGYRVEAMLQCGGPSAPRLSMTFFSRSERMANWQRSKLSPGTKGVFMGKAGSFRGHWQLTNPRMMIFGDPKEDAEAELAIEELTDLYPIYPLTKGLSTWDVQRAIRFARETVQGLWDPIPESVREEYSVLDLRTALDWIHAPDDFGQVERARRRFRFEEALVLQLVLGRRRRERAAEGATAREGGVSRLLDAFEARLPFELTIGQRAVGAEIEADLARPHPMNRLLQGEVGSGKTVVAVRAMLRVVDSGGQAALLAPTEVLAQQHFQTITALLGDLAGVGLLGAEESTAVELLTGSMTKTQRTGPLSRIASGEAGIVVGTHALLQENVSFADLGLVVVDEQHRFGVEQRAALTDKADTAPHVLVMTATPIPRTVAMTVFGDLEVSTLTEVPADRGQTQTSLVPLAERPAWIHRVWERVREEVEQGRQAFVVAPRIAGDQVELADVVYLHQVDVDQAEGDDQGEGVAATGEEDEPAPPSAVEEVVEELAQGPLEGLRLGVLHGRLPAEEKERAMRAFAAGDIDVLVSTTVVEVGVDVPNATTMVILDADRFGVSQLHQLRGRVGRGRQPGLCLLVSRAEQGTPARTRLEAVAATSDGFELSRVDLEQRREGDVLGASQSGIRSSLENLRVLRDEDTIVAARAAAEQLLDEDSDLVTAPLLAQRVVEVERTAQAEFLEKA